MNKTTKIAVAVVPLLLAYPLTAWVIGQRVETAIAQNQQLLAENPSLKIVKRDYRRGIFSATETLTIELFGNLTQAALRQQQAAMAANPELKLPPPQALQLTIRSRIKHGPLPGLSTFAAATADSELVLDGALQQQAESVFGDKQPLRVHTQYRFDGGGSSALSIPAFSTYWQASEGAGRNTLAWDGLEMSVDFDQGMRRYTLHAEAPRLEIKESRGGQLTLVGIKLEAAQQRVFDDEPLLYAGSQKMTLAQVSVGSGAEGSVPAELRRVSFDAEIPVQGDFIDLVARLGSESLRIGGKDYGPAHYDFSLRHVHARTLVALYRQFLKLSADVELQALAPAEPAQLLAPLTTPALELLKHNPELAIDRLSFRSPHGDAALALRIKFKDLQAQDLANPLLLAAKLDASADLSLPEGLLADFAGGLPGSEPAAALTATEADAAAASAAVAARNEQLRQRLEEMTAQGFVVRDGSLLKSKLVFSNGQMTVNGQPFNPLGGTSPPAVAQ